MFITLFLLCPATKPGLSPEAGFSFGGDPDASPLRNEETRHEERRQENARRHDGEDEEEKGDEEKALMKNTKSGRAQARRVRTHLKSSAMSRAKKTRTARSINQPSKKKTKS